MKMKRFARLIFIAAIFILLIRTTDFASELIFQFKDPSFGGSPLYGSYLLQQAQIQDKFKESLTKKSTQKSLVQQFQESLARQIMYQIAYKIVKQAFGETELAAGTYQIGTYLIQVTPLSDRLTVHITDTASGSETVIEVPYY
ncbi:MAG: curli production assembly/transport component CsgF [Thermosulfidibacteraceae bacterium]|jgi:curli production assembly/transport component CsgF